ncbi:MAG TPA: ABC transporter permease [Fimbriimonadaceae bacterium]|nr:ABC transporter permease [Fimbriimonadaceae bacterium]
MKREWIALLLIAILCLAVGLAEPRYLQPRSIDSILLWMPLTVVLAMGQHLVVITGGIDISIGSILAFAGIGVGLLLKAQPGLPIPLAFACGIAIGLVLGFVNAALIVWLRLAPLIATIGTLAAFRGLTFALSKGDQIDGSTLPDGLTSLASNGVSAGGVTVSWLLVIGLGVAGATALFLRFGAAGRALFAVGSNAEAARLRGVSLSKATFVAYSTCGALAGLAGVMYAARFGFVNPGSAGQNFELTVIAAVAIGGAKLTGGSGTVTGTLLGCLLLSCINVALSTLGIDANWQLLAYGTVILAAIVVDGIRSKAEVAR